MATTSIEWTDRVWNPVTGCTKVSTGCKNCYAETIAERFWATQYPPIQLPVGDLSDPLNMRPRQFTDVMWHEDRLLEPLSWRKPAKVFVNSMSDLFHEDVPDAFIERVFSVMALAERHTFQVLTKRADRMRAWFSARRFDSKGSAILQTEIGECHYAFQWPLPNVWLGVSVEDQQRADERIPLLLQTPAAVRFISAEPLLGPLNLGDLQPMRGKTKTADGLKPLIHFPEYNALTGECVRDRMGFDGPTLDWVIVGGESGPGARPFDVSWARSIVRQCKEAGIACFVKQLGSDPRDAAAERDDMCARELWPDGWMLPLEGRRVWRPDVTDRKGGDPAEWPADLRVREFPR